MENAAERTRPKRVPLADRTNIPSKPHAKPIKPSHRLLRRPPPPPPAGAAAAAGSHTHGTSAGQSLVSCKSRGKSVTISVCVDREDSTPLKSQNRQIPQPRKTDRGKAVVELRPLSCPPLGRKKSLSNKVDKVTEESRDTALSEIQPVSPSRKKKKRRVSMPDHTLPQEFIDKQRAYFAEIDAFELQEEEVSE